jgi:sugar transferase (PEP-CTERM/EpsH1 system associated)
LKILVALSRFPWPTNKGDKLRAWHQLVGMSNKNEVHVFCLTDEVVQPQDLEKAQSVFASVHVFTLSKFAVLTRLSLATFQKIPFQVAYFSDRKAIAEFNSLVQQINPDVVYCQLARMAEFCRNLDNCKKLIDYQDAFSMGLERRITNEPWWKKHVVAMEAKRLKTYESQIFEDFDERTMISEQDAKLINHPLNTSLQIIPNGVDTDFYKPEPRARVIDLLFTGNMQYEPNVNCVKYVVENVIPLLIKEFPYIQFVAAGMNPSKELYLLKSRNLQLTGWVDDLRNYYQLSRIFVAPMQIGIGMQNKILEAMSMGLPVITTSLANNAIGATHGKEIWIANTPEKVAEAISYLLNNTELAINIGHNARKLMEEQFSWDKQNTKLIRLMNACVSEDLLIEPISEK